FLLRFQALLSTGHKGGYSQGLIHRKASVGAKAAHGKAVLIDVISQVRCSNALKRTEQAGANGLPGISKGLFTDAKTGEDPSQ
ncbi:MAG: hypothetical protein ACK418_11850, partial [Pseudomonas sp.]